MPIDFALLGKRIRRKRNLMKMTQERLAEAADLSNVYVSKLENGLANPTLSTLMKISGSLKTTTAYLVEGYVCEQDEIQSELSTLLEECSPSTLQILRSMIKAIKNSKESD